MKEKYSRLNKLITKKESGNLVFNISLSCTVSDAEVLIEEWDKASDCNYVFDWKLLERLEQKRVVEIYEFWKKFTPRCLAMGIVADIVAHLNFPTELLKEAYESGDEGVKNQIACLDTIPKSVEDKILESNAAEEIRHLLFRCSMSKENRKVALDKVIKLDRDQDFINQIKWTKRDLEEQDLI